MIKFFIVLLGLLGLFLALSFNIGRLTSESESRDLAQYYTEYYIEKTMGSGYSCEVESDVVNVGKLPQHFTDLIGGQLMYAARWKCKNKVDEALGYYTLYSDGQSILSGRSNLGGQLPSYEH